MILDGDLQLADGQQFTANGATTDLADLGNEGFGRGEPLALVFNNPTAAEFGDANETYQFSVETDSAEGMGSKVTVAQSRAFNGDELPAGSKVVLPLAPGQVKQYVQGFVTVGGTTPDITVDAWIVPLANVQTWAAFPDGD